jgi:hypothetical protein
MSSVATKKALATALAGAAIASLVVAPAGLARPIEQMLPSAATEDSGSRSIPPPSSIAASAAGEYDNMRSTGATPTASQPVVDAPSPAQGFDLPSAAIGAAAGTGVVILLLAAGALVRRHPPTGRHGAARA